MLLRHMGSRLSDLVCDAGGGLLAHQTPAVLLLLDLCLLSQGGHGSFDYDGGLVVERCLAQFSGGACV